MVSNYLYSGSQCHQVAREPDCINVHSILPACFMDGTAIYQPTRNDAHSYHLTKTKAYEQRE